MHGVLQCIGSGVLESREKLIAALTTHKRSGMLTNQVSQCDAFERKFHFFCHRFAVLITACHLVSDFTENKWRSIALAVTPDEVLICDNILPVAVPECRCQFRLTISQLPWPMPFYVSFHFTQNQLNRCSRVCLVHVAPSNRWQTHRAYPRHSLLDIKIVFGTTWNELAIICNAS